MSINSEEYCLHLYTCIYLYINDWSVMCLKILHTGMCGIKFLVNARNLFNLCRFHIDIQLLMYKRQNDCESWVCTLIYIRSQTQKEIVFVVTLIPNIYSFLHSYMYVVTSLYLVFSVIIQVNTLSASAVIPAKEGREI